MGRETSRRRGSRGRRVRAGMRAPTPSCGIARARSPSLEQLLRCRRFSGVEGDMMATVAPLETDLRQAAEERYLSYALSVITSRALPDVRDGLKPVQRRILYAMFQNLRLTAGGRARKSAAVVGEVLGKYHPHGDLAAKEAMIRMAQPFALRYPLVHGEGNFGSLDGDGAAAMRYTEVRLARVAQALLEDLENETVPFRGTYDAT